VIAYPVRSALADFHHFGVPDTKGAYALAMQYQLLKSQWFSAEELLALQLKQLHSVLKHACSSVPFYQQHYRDVGLRFDRPLSAEVFSSLPILKREHVQREEDALLSLAIPASHGGIHVIETSGSTGRAVRFRGTDITQLFWRAFTLRDHAWHKRDLGAKLAGIRWVDGGLAMPPDGQVTQGWGIATDVVFQTGAAVLLNIASDTDAQMAWLVKHKPAYLLSYPSHLGALADYSIRHSIRLPGLKEVRTLGETLPDKVRELCREAWGVKVCDMYSCEELGYLALQCPEFEHYHVQAENVFFEVLKESGAPCEPGEVGRVVVSGLNNFASPILRYELGDYAEVGEPCACGRGLPVIKRILGRVRNRLIMPDGESRFPYLGDRDEARKITTAVKKFQFVQKSLSEIEYKVVVVKRLSKAQEGKMRRFIQKNLGQHFKVTISYHDDIVCGPTGKFEEFVSEVSV